jgi:hypothetical protein
MAFGGGVGKVCWRTDTVELRCLGQRKCFGPTLERDPQRRLGNSARWFEQSREIVGWARPDEFPPRNMRTSKLRALGYNVRIGV